MPCELHVDGRIALIKVAFEVHGSEVSDYDVVGLANDGLIDRADLHAELTGVVRRACGSTDVEVASVDFRRGSVIATVLIVGKLVIEIGSFLGALREIRTAVGPLIARFLEASVAATNPAPISVTQTGATVELGSGGLEATVEESSGAAPAAPSPAPHAGGARPANLREPIIVLLAASVLVLLILATILATLID